MADTNPKRSNKDRMKEITEQLERGIKEVFESDRYAAYLSVMSRFHTYSARNQVLIHMQRPDATLLAGFNKWKNQFSRHVKRGERGITIIAPTPFKKKIEELKRDPDTKAPILDQDGKAIIEEREIEIPMFKPVSVFDVSQTEGKPLPQLAAPLYGDVQQYEAFMEALRRTSPVPMELLQIAADMDGYFDPNRQNIVLRTGMSEVQTVSAAVHEISHATMHNYEKAAAESGEQVKPKDRRTEEVEAESVSFVVCQYFGLQTSENSFGYIATWSKDKELPELRASLETISKTAGSLITSIEKHFREVCKERGIDLEAAQPETEAPTQPLVRHEYRLHDNFEHTSPADSSYIQEYTVAEDLSLTPGEVLYTGTYDECVKLHTALRDGSMTAEQVKAQARADKLYELDEKLYLHIQPCDGGYDYTLYDKASMRELDGGQLDAPQLPISAACLKICDMHDIGNRAIAYAPLEMVETLREAQSEPPANPRTAELIEHFMQEDTEAEDAPPLEQALDEYPMPDPVLRREDMERCGYLDNDLLPISKERAQELMEQDLTVYLMESGENPEMAFDPEDLEAHGGIFAVPREEWEASQEFAGRVASRMERQTEREAAFLAHKGDCFAIYQLRHDNDLHGVRYQSLETLRTEGHRLMKSDYDLVYTAPLENGADTDKALGRLWHQFNMKHPADYRAPSMSVSDIVVLNRAGVVSCHYVDPSQFTELPGFFSGKNMLRAAEDSIEQNDNQIDGIINNTPAPPVAELEARAKEGQQISLMDLAAAAHRERKGKKPSVLGQLRSQPKQEHKKSTPRKTTERDI